MMLQILVYRRLASSAKKTIAASERDEARRCTFRLQILQHAAKQFMIVDQSGYNLNLTPGYARAPRGQRAHAKLPGNVPANTTVIAALSSTGMGATMLLEGATDHHVVEAYVRVVLDNLSARKRAEIKPLLQAVGCDLWFLPPYSPDLAPIELAFAKIKQAVRRAACRTRETLEAAIAQALT
jgi:transposase